MRPDAAIRVSLLPQKGQFVLERLQTYQTVAPEIAGRGPQDVLSGSDESSSEAKRGKKYTCRE